MARRRRSVYIFTEKKKRHPFRKAFGLLAALVLVSFSAAAAFNFASMNQVTLESCRVTVTNLPSDLENWSILHLSDLHGATYGEGQSGIRRVVKDMNVSCVVMTGDMLGKDGDIGPLLALLPHLPADKPKMLVLGDEDPDYLDATAHGSLSPKADWAVALEKAGVTILDEPLLFTRGKNDAARIWFIPEDLYDLDVDNMEQTYQALLSRLNAKTSLSADEAAQKRVAEYQVARAQRIRESVRSMKATDVQVAVCHAPVTQQRMNEALSAADKSKVFSLRQASLILCGHYCAGQWRIPGKGAMYVPELGWWPDDALLQGLGYVGGIPQYISPGLGSSGFYPYQPFRLFNPPKVTYLLLSSRFQ